MSTPLSTPYQPQHHHPDLQDPALRASLAQRSQAARELLQRIASEYGSGPGQIAFANSLGAEDMVITDLIQQAQLTNIEIFSLDTGRLPSETYDLMATLRKHYGLTLRLYYPRHELIEAYTSEKGINAFYESVALRKECCFIRKVEPLGRALAGKRAWITGQRAQQSATRAELPVQAYDAEHGLEKFNPLAEWTTQEVWAYIRTHHVPYNALHDKHYPSIGCAPCTRAISAGEDIRAGRWWWESADTKECGLHAQNTLHKK